MSRVNHGLSKTRIYRIYHRMIYRCKKDKNCEAYKLYRENNIVVCDEWLGDNGFLNFYKWSMQNGYSDELTIDRIDGTKGYSPDNCRWATYKTQGNNTKRNRFITYNGKTQTMSQWAEDLGIPYQRLNSRINNSKMSIEEAFSTEIMDNQTRGLEIKPKTEIDGERKYIYEWAKDKGMNPSTISNRVSNGMSIKDAVNTRKFQQMPQSKLDELFADYYSGMPEDEICKKYNTSSASICRYRKRYGKPVRDSKYLYQNRKVKHGF